MSLWAHMTYDAIMDRMLRRIPDTLDKREGSIIWDALGPAALELSLLYVEMDRVLDEMYAETASYPYLERRAVERGLTPYPPSKAILYAEFNCDVPIGSRFSLETNNYRVIKKIDDFHYELECEQEGSVGNQYFGTMIPIQYIDGLTHAEIKRLLVPGEDKEDIEHFRLRYLDSFQLRAYGGNIRDYREKTNAIPGVGATKVTPIWAGGGTVKLTILDAEYKPATPELVRKVQEIIDPQQDQKGLGVAPIGHIVTVEPATATQIAIDTQITFDDAHTFSGHKAELEAKVREYLLTLAKEWETAKSTTVRISQMEALFLAVPGVIDVGRTKINGKAENLTLPANAVPVLQEIRNG